MRSNFACYVNSSLVVELVSLEVSVVRNGSRVVLAYINRSERSLLVSLADSLSLNMVISLFFLLVPGVCVSECVCERMCVCVSDENITNFADQQIRLLAIHAKRLCLLE